MCIYIHCIYIETRFLRILTKNRRSCDGALVHHWSACECRHTTMRHWCATGCPLQRRHRVIILWRRRGTETKSKMSALSVSVSVVLYGSHMLRQSKVWYVSIDRLQRICSEYVGELHRVTGMGDMPRWDLCIFEVCNIWECMWVNYTESQARVICPRCDSYIFDVCNIWECMWVNYTESQTRVICPAVTRIFLTCVIYGSVCGWITQSHRHGLHAPLWLVCKWITQSHRQGWYAHAVTRMRVNYTESQMDSYAVQRHTYIRECMCVYVCMYGMSRLQRQSIMTLPCYILACVCVYIDKDMRSTSDSQ